MNEPDKILLNEVNPPWRPQNINITISNNDNDIKWKSLWRVWTRVYRRHKQLSYPVYNTRYQGLPTTPSFQTLQQPSQIQLDKKLVSRHLFASRFEHLIVVLRE